MYTFKTLVTYTAQNAVKIAFPEKNVHVVTNMTFKTRKTHGQLDIVKC